MAAGAGRCCFRRVVAVGMAMMVCVAAVAAAGRVAPEADIGALDVPKTWVDEGAAASSEMIGLTFALKQRNLRALENKFWAVSDPAAADYGKFMSRDEIADMIAPPASAAATVGQWLAAFNPAKVEVSKSRDFLHAQLSVESASAALGGIEFRRFRHVESGKVLVRSLSHYTLPRRIAALVDFVAGANRLPMSSFAAATVGTKFAARASEAAAALPAGNAPLIAGSLGGETAQILVLPRCSDGSVMTGSFGSCPAKTASVSGLSVTAANVNIAQTIMVPGSALPSLCATCLELGSRQPYGPNNMLVCGGAGQSWGLPNINGTVYCAVTMDDLETAVSSNFTAVASFTNGSQSPSSPITPQWMEPVVTPALMHSLYSIPAGATGNVPGITQAVVEFLEQYYSPADLTQYLNMFNITGTKPVDVEGPNDATNPGLEATLDIQVILAIAPDVPTTFYSTPGLRNNSAPASSSNQEPFLTWILGVADTDSPPLVHSVSYMDPEGRQPLSYTNRLNVEFMKAGVRGMSLFFSAGDDGAGGYHVRTYGNCPELAATFPPSSPYVTAVGGTQLANANNKLQEVTSSSATGSFITTGGGFSARYAMPSYQTELVKQYIVANVSGSVPPAGMFNASSRAYPDIAGIATNYITIQNGFDSPVGGTSASTPLIAGIVSLLNAARAAQGLPQIGFANPLFYALYAKNANAFQDVTIGNNKCSAYPNLCCQYGYGAAPGWDANTGLGTPNVKEILGMVAPSA